MLQRNGRTLGGRHAPLIRFGELSSEDEQRQIIIRSGQPIVVFDKGWNCSLTLLTIAEMSLGVCPKLSLQGMQY